MRVKLDENMPEAAAVLLVSFGWDVESVLSEKLGGAADPLVVFAAKTEGRMLITLDKGIANLRNPDYARHAGLVLLRLKHPSVKSIVALLETHHVAISDPSLAGKIVVLSTGGMRIR